MSIDLLLYKINTVRIRLSISENVLFRNMENTDHNLRQQLSKKSLKFNFGQNFIVL